LARVLRPQGHHVFTVPLQEPVAQKTVARVDVAADEDRLLLPAYYRGNGKGGRSLVYNDFGLDIVDLLSQAGFATHLRRPATASGVANRVFTVVCARRPSTRSETSNPVPTPISRQG
jgi:hypothetical protein